MTAADDIQNQHDVVVPEDDQITPEDAGDNDIEGVTEDIDKLHEEAFGDEDKKTIGKEVDQDEIAQTKGLTKKQQK